MKSNTSIVGLVGLNLVLLVCVAAQRGPAPDPGVQSIVRTRAFELVDEKGHIRASLNVGTNGEAVFRLRDAEETIRLKLGASKEGSALLLLDDSTSPGLEILAKHGTTLMLTHPDGRKRIIEP